MTPLITKQQIGKFVTLSENIDDLLIDTFIRDAQEFDTISVFPIALLNAISLNVEARIQQWKRTETYSVGSIVYYESPPDKFYFTCLTINTDSQPPNVNWEDNELMNFYRNYLQPFIAYSFYYRFIAYHGAHITESGITEIVGEGVQTISDRRRGEILGDIKSKVNVWTGKISKKLNDVNFTFDDVQYLPESGKNTRIKQGVRIYALGSDRSGSIKDRCCPDRYIRE